MKKYCFALSVLALLFACTPAGSLQEDANNSESSGNGNEEGYGNENSGNQEVVTTAIEAIDIGLSVKWGSCNLGASAPEDIGGYFAWGELEPKSNYKWQYYKWSNGDHEKLTKYCPADKSDFWDGDGEPDNKTFLDPEDDAAHVILGGKWRLPTPNDVEELYSTKENASYNWEWKALNGHNGWLITYLINNNTLFLPATGHIEETEIGRPDYGYYRTSSLVTGYTPSSALDMKFYSREVSWSYRSRSDGLCIRPVAE